MKQTSPPDKGALATSWYERSNLGTRINNEGTVSATLRFRYEFRGRNSFKGGGGGGGSY